MPGFLENVGKAAVRSAARAAVKAETAARRAQLQGDLDRQQAQVLRRYARLGRLVLEAGGPLPEGAKETVAAIREAEGHLGRLRAELAKLDG